MSGGPYYLARIANSIADIDNIEVYYTDYEDGLHASIIKNSNIHLLIYNNEGGDFRIFPEEPVVVIMPIYWAHMVPKVHRQTKIVFFNWHNECIPVLKDEWIATDELISDFLELVSENDAEFFLDKAHWMAQKAYGKECKERYVPIAIPPRKLKAEEELVEKDRRNIAVLGRLVQDKIYAVLDLVDSIIELRDDVETNIYIIGEGDKEDLLFKKRIPSYINLIECGTMAIDDILILLAEKVDILFAMGTSVLDGASIGLPSAVLPNDMKAFRCNQYPFLNEVTGYALGWYPSQIEELEMETHSVKEIFELIYQKKQKKQIGVQCYKYYQANHVDNVGLFLEAVENSQLTDEKYREFIKKSKSIRLFLRRLKYNLRRLYGRKTHQLRLFGFPIYTITWSTDYHINIFILCIPLIRINKYENTIGIHFLPAIWFGKAIRKIIRRLKLK